MRSYQDSSSKSDARSCLAAVKLYVFLVLIPQLLWVASYATAGGYAYLSFCEGCSPHTTSMGPASADPNSAQEQQPRSNLLSNISKADPCTCHIDRNLEDAFKADSIDSPGGWYIPHSLPDLSGPCNIKVINSSLSQLEFLTMFAYKEPVVLRGMSDQTLLRTQSARSVLLRDYGQSLITVATANTHSYRKVQMTLCEYITKVMKPQTMEMLGNETLYHFGDNDREGWKDLFSLYKLPPFTLPGLKPVLSFGLAGPGTGVPFHIHGPTFAETIFGRKRWFLYPPKHRPRYNPDDTTLHWLVHVFPTLEVDDRPLECTLSPGDIIYFPDHWWHATLNLDTAVFMSTFFG